MRKEVAEIWKRELNEELHNLYASPNIIRVTKSRESDECARSTHWRDRNAYKNLGGTLEWKRPRGWPRRR